MANTHSSDPKMILRESVGGKLLELLAQRDIITHIWV